MPRIAIITDSTAAFPDGIAEKYDVEVLPQVLIWGDETLQDGVDISPTEFYERLAIDDITPTTSQATVGQFKVSFEPHVAAGTPILAILISSKLSGTVQSALQAKEFFPGATIEIIDSDSVAMAMGFQVLAAVEASVDGKSFEDVVEIAKRARDRTGVIFVVDTLEFLHRGGRIGGAAKLLGSALNMKPVLEVRDGRVESIERVRTKTKAHARLLDLIEDRVKEKSKLRFSGLHANAEDEARRLLAQMCARCPPVEEYMTVVTPVLGTHAGPGTVGIAYYAEE